MSDTEGEIPPVHTTEQEAEPEVTPPPEPEKKGMATTTSKETNLSGLSTYQKLLREETGWQPKFRISPADAAGIEASKSVKAVRDKAYTGDNYKGLTIKVPDLKTVGWEKWSMNLKATWRQLSCHGMPPNDTRTDTTTVRQSTRLPSDTLPTRTTTQPPQGGDRTRISYEGHLYLTIAYLSACT